MARKTITRLRGIDKGFRKDTLVFAKGPTGQKIRIAGEDAFTGGVGSRSNDEVFGGETFGGNWTTYNESGDRAHVYIASRQAVVWTANYSVYAYFHNNDTGQQDTDGDLTFECIVKKRQPLDNVGNTRIGLMEIRAGVGIVDSGCYLYNNDDDNTDEWKPICKNDEGTTTGNIIVIADDTYFRLKIVFEASGASFYINGVLQEKLTGNLSDDEPLSPGIALQSAPTSNDDTYVYCKKMKWNFT